MKIKNTDSLFVQLKVLVYRWIKHFEYVLQLLRNKTVRSQLRNPKSIPIIIINFNQLFFLKNLIDDLTVRNYENIVIVDNHSHYPPLLQFYQNIEKESNITIERMENNFGHKVFFENEQLQNKYGDGFYVVTDADINFYKNTPANFMIKLLQLLIRNHLSVSKVGFALNLNDIPENYVLKDKVLKWENRFWENEVDKNVFFAAIDTTFALYHPGFPRKNNKSTFYRAFRVAGKYVVKHGGWYQNSLNLTDEQLYYKQSANNSYSWKNDNDGNIDSEFKDLY